MVGKFSAVRVDEGQLTQTWKVRKSFRLEEVFVLLQNQRKE